MRKTHFASLVFALSALACGVFGVVLHADQRRIATQELTRELDRPEPRTSMIKLLVARGGSIEATSRTRRTPLIVAAQSGDYDLVDFLLRRGADVNARDVDRHTALLHAAVEGHSRVAIRLMEAGTDVNLSGHWGDTPLMWAAARGDVQLTKILLQRGANREAANDTLTTAYDAARDAGHKSLLDLLRTDAGVLPGQKQSLRPKGER